MQRANRYLKSLGSNYLLLVVNAVYTLATVPIALHYLNKEQFGVWIVVAQISSFLAMIDLGMGDAGVRLLIDHKDFPNDGTYGSLIKAAMLAQSIQGALIFAVGAALVPMLSGWLKVPALLVGDFNLLCLWQIGLLSFNFFGRISVQLLSAHQRSDVVNYSQAIGIVLNFAVLVFSFHMHLGLFSFVLGQTFATVVVLAGTVAASVRLKFFPSRWGPISTAEFRSLFGFGSEVFLVTVGGQFVNCSQTFLLARLLGLEAAAVWSVMTRLFTLLTLLTGRLISVAAPAFAEMLVRGEHERLCRRYRSMFKLSLLASCYFGLLVGFGNSAFVDVWLSMFGQKGGIQWRPLNDWLLAIWFVILLQSASHNVLVVSTKRVQAAKYIYFLEGVAFVAASILIVPRAGISGMLACSIVCTLGFSFAYGTRRAARWFDLPARHIALNWFAPAARLLAISLPFGALLAFLTQGSSVLRLGVCVIPLAIVAALVTVRLCIPHDLMADVITHLPGWLRRPAKFVVGHESGPAISEIM
jgi:O-antigen/teichoic acid export membrane protein